MGIKWRERCIGVAEREVEGSKRGKWRMRDGKLKMDG